MMNVLTVGTSEGSIVEDTPVGVNVYWVRIGIGADVMSLKINPPRKKKPSRKLGKK